MGFFKLSKNIFARTVTGWGNLITSGIEKASGRKFGRTTPEQFLGSKTGKGLSTAFAVTSAVAGGVALRGAVITRGGIRAVGVPIIKKVVSSAIPTTLRGKVLAGTGSLISVGILKESKKARSVVVKTIKEIPKIPEKVIGFGGDVGKVIEKEKTFGKEDVVSGFKKAGVVGGVVGLGALVIPKVIDKVKEIKDKPIVPDVPVVPIVPQETGGLVKEKPIGIEGETPLLPETTTISTGKKRSKQRRARKKTSIRQSVKININNRATGLRITNKRYLNDSLILR